MGRHSTIRNVGLPRERFNVESNLVLVRNLLEFAQNLLRSATIQHTPGWKNKLFVQIVHVFLGTLVVVPRAETNGKMPND